LVWKSTLRSDVRRRAGGLLPRIIGPPAYTIVRHAADIGAGLIAETSHGRSGLRRVIMGSVAEQIFRTAPCPILVLPAAQVAKRVRLVARKS